MRSKMKTLVMLALVCSLGMGSTYTPSAFAGEIRQPESFSINGEIVYDNTEESGMVVEEENGIRSRMLLGYEYVPGHERLINQTTVFDFAKIYSTSVNFCEGASPSYTLTVTKSKTKTTGWNVSGSLSGEFDIKAVKVELEGKVEHEDKETATISCGQTWNSGFTTPGLYELTWYMRGYRYTCQCGAKYISTDSNDGKFTYYKLGTVTFPTDEIHFDVTRVK